MVGNPQKTQFLIRLSPELKAWVESEAAKNYTSRNSVIIRCIAATMEREAAAPAAE